MSTTYYLENKILDYNIGNTSYSVPGTLYVGLSTSAINNDGTGSTEPSGTGYARVAVTNNKTNFGNAASGVLTNLVSVTFSESTASWGTITHVFIADALTSGNILYFDALAVPRAVAANTTIYFSPSNLSISIVNA